MRRLLGRGLALLAIVCVILGLLDLVAAHLVPPTIFDKKLTLEDEVDLSRIQVAVFGTSRPYNAVDPRVLPWPAFSFCDSARPMEFCYQIFLRQAPRMPHLKAIVVGIDEFGFGLDDSSLPCIEDYLNHGYDSPHASLQTRLNARFPLLRYRTDILPELLGRLIGHSRYTQSTIEDGDEPSHPDEPVLLRRYGFMYVPPKPADISDASAMKRAKDRVSGYDRSLRAESRAVLTRFIDAALARHVAVVLLRTPMPASYRRHVSPVMVRECEEDLATVLAPYSGNQVRLLSYWDRPFPDEAWLDADHVNNVGARRLTGLLAGDMASLMGPQSAAR